MNNVCTTCVSVMVNIYINLYYYLYFEEKLCYSFLFLACVLSETTHEAVVITPCSWSMEGHQSTRERRNNVLTSGRLQLRLYNIAAFEAIKDCWLPLNAVSD